MLGLLIAILCATLALTVTITFSGNADTSSNGDDLTISAGSIDSKCNHEWSHGNAMPIAQKGGPIKGLIENDTYIPSYFFLDSDITLDSDIVISGHVEICLNGHTLTGTGSSSVIKVDSSSTNFVLYDCDENSSAGTITGGNTSYGGGVRTKGGTFTMNGGVISNNTATDGGGVCVSASGNLR